MYFLHWQVDSLPLAPPGKPLKNYEWNHLRVLQYLKILSFNSDIGISSLTQTCIIDESLLFYWAKLWFERISFTINGKTCSLWLGSVCDIRINVLTWLERFLTCWAWMISGVSTTEVKLAFSISADCLYLIYKRNIQ